MSASIIRLAKIAVNDRSRVDAALALADLISLITTYLSIDQRYCVADRLRNVADNAERASDIGEVGSC